MDRARLRTALIANAGAVVGVCLIVWGTGSKGSLTTLVGIGTVGILILNAAMLYTYRRNRRTAAPNQRSHFGSVLMSILILFAILLHFLTK